MMGLYEDVESEVFDDAKRALMTAPPCLPVAPVMRRVLVMLKCVSGSRHVKAQAVALK